MTTNPNRGTCRVCGNEFNLTANGRIRSHGPKAERCAGGSDLPAGALTTGEQVVSGMREQDGEPTPRQVIGVDLRPTASEFAAAQQVLGSDWSEIPGDVISAAERTAYRGRAYGVRPNPESETKTAANGTPMTVHGGPNPFRAPLPNGAAPEQLAEMAARQVGGASADFAEGADNAEPRPDAVPAPVAFDRPAPVAAPKADPYDSAHAVRPGPEKSDFDQWGRYKLPDPATGKATGRQRVTTFAKMISDQWGLSRWQQRMLLKGAAAQPEAVARAAGLDVKTHATLMDGIADALKDAAGDKAAADKGTRIHRWTELVDLGKLSVDEVPEADRADVAAYVRALYAAGLAIDPHMVERTTMCRELDVAGTLDRAVLLPNGEHVIFDVKTGQDLTYGWLDIGVQLACYARGVNENGVWDWENRQWLAAPKVRTDFAIVAHMPAGTGTCTLYRVDLDKGWANCILAVQVREARKERRHSTLLATDGPEFRAPVPVPGSDAYLAADDAAEIANRHQAREAAAPQPLQVQPHTSVFDDGKPAPSFEDMCARMSIVTDTDQAAACFSDAAAAGFTGEFLNRLGEIGTERLTLVAQAREAFASVTDPGQAYERWVMAQGMFGEGPFLDELVASATAALKRLGVMS